MGVHFTWQNTVFWYRHCVLQLLSPCTNVYHSLSTNRPSILIYEFFIVFFFLFSGESMNAVPHYHKLCSRVSHIWGNRRGQHIQSAMDKPPPGKTTFVIMVPPLPGKYDFLWIFHLCSLPRVLPNLIPSV